jgi:hypothetical protein
MSIDDSVDDLPDVFGFTLFCDDIRAEIGAKTSFIGVYRGVLFVHSQFPVTLPKFGFAIRLEQKREVFVPNVKLMIFLPGDAQDAPSLGADVVEEQAGAVITAEPGPTEPPLIRMEAHMVASPLVLKQAGVIKVRASLGERIVKLGRLAVRSTTGPDSTTA